jgi:hypothetical protein
MIRNKNTENYMDGVVKIYTLTNTAEPGCKPAFSETLKETLRFRERTVGVTRFYTALESVGEIARLIRCPLRRNVTAHDIAVIIADGPAAKYEIGQIQYPEGVVPKAMDLSLVRTDRGGSNV